MNTIKELTKTIIVAMILIAGVSLVSAWTAPTQIPPGGNVSAPVNVGALSQYKSGAFGVGGLFRAYGNAIVDGSLSIGTASPTQKLDVNGDIKTNAGIWLGGVRKTDWPSGEGTVVSSGLYGYCYEYYSAHVDRSANNGCTSADIPAMCLSRKCACQSGYTLKKTGICANAAGFNYCGAFYSCYKN